MHFNIPLNKTNENLSSAIWSFYHKTLNDLAFNTSIWLPRIHQQITELLNIFRFPFGCAHKVMHNLKNKQLCS